MTFKVLDWGLFGSFGTNLNSGGTVDTGGIEVSLDFNKLDFGATATTSSVQQYVDADDPFSTNSSLQLYGLGGNTSFEKTSKTTLNFSSTNPLFADEVQNVNFRINDIDRGNYKDNHVDRVTVKAYDAAGNLVPVTITSSGQHLISGNTVTGLVSDTGNVRPSSKEASVEYFIAGPVSRIEILYENGECTDQAVWITDVHFETIPGIEPDGIVSGTPGDDLIDVAYTGDPDGDRVDNNDAILPGQTGNMDIIDAGCGNDTVFAGEDDDLVFAGGGNDKVFGGPGNDTIYGDSNFDGTIGGEGLSSEDAFDKVAINFSSVRPGSETAAHPNTAVAGSSVIYDNVATLDDGTQVSAKLVLVGKSSSHLKVDLASSDDYEILLNANNNSHMNGQTATFRFEFFNTATGAAVTLNPALVFADLDRNHGTEVITIHDPNLVNVGVPQPSSLAVTYADGALVAKGTEDNIDPNDLDSQVSTLFSATSSVTFTMTSRAVNSGLNFSTIDAQDFHYLDDFDNCAPGDDYLDGGDGDDLIFGEAGNDTLIGAAGNDTLFGGEGDDLLKGGSGDDELHGDDGNDTIYFGTGNDTVFGGAGNDLIDDAAGTMLEGNDLLFGGDGDDTIYAGLGDDTVHGDAGNDLLFGEAGNNELYGGEGDDRVFGGTGNDTIFGGDGNDSLRGGAGDDVIYGDAGNDTLTGDAGNDTIFGGDGNNVIFGGDGRDVIFAGPGDYVDGGSGGDDYDILDVTAHGPYVLENLRPDSNGNGFDGTIVFVDADGVPTGGRIDFVEIEEIRGTEFVPNRPPLAEDDAFSGDEDTEITGNVLDNDSDPDGDPLTVIANTDPSNGTVTVNPDGSFVYTPEQDFNGTDSFTYTVSDGRGGEATATVTITVNPVNDDPVAGDDFATTPFNQAVVIDVLANDTDVDGDELSVLSVEQPDNGTVTINADGTVTYTPDTGFQGTDSFTYVVSDGQGGTDTATVTVTVQPPVLDGIVSGTPDDDFIGTDSPLKPGFVYEGDPEGDLVDSEDAILPGAAPNDDVIFGFEGNDTIDAGLGDDLVYGGEDNDLIFGREGEDTLYGDEGDDTIYGGEGDDVIFGGDGDDLLYGDEGNDQIFGGAGDDRIFGGAGDDTIEGGDGNDSIRGNDGNDLIFGGAGDDTIRGGDGDDTIYGDEGNDSLIGGDGNDVIYGGDGDDVIRGVTGDDLIFGGDGNDTIFGEDGRDTVYGGAGDDFIDTSSRPGVSNPLPDIGFPGLYPADPDPDDDRDLVFGGDGNDTIFTGDDADTIYGGAGDDYIDGGIDADLIYGGPGNDTIIGGEGADTIYGGDGDDLIFGGLGPDAPDFINLPNEIDPVPDNNPDIIYGGAGNDTIFGADDDDILYGGEGDDYIDGGVDNDLIYGDEGNDTLLGGHGDDTIFGGEGDDEIFGGIGEDLLFGGTGNDTIDGGDGNDTIFGEEGDDLIIAGTGENEIFGGDGNDTIIGSGGGDLLFGGDGRDVFTNVGIGDQIFGGSGGDDYDVLDLRGSAPEGGKLKITITGPDENGNGFDGFVTYRDADGNEVGQLTFAEIEEIIPCFTPGTAIATPKGERLVEELQVGDRVITRDNGIQEIRWVGAKPITGREMAANPHLKPILIREGALGNGLPERDMMVSPNHRLLVNNDKTALYFEEREVLAAAKHLVGAPGIHAVDVLGTSYIHFMFDHHEVVLSNGSWTESFQPGDMSLKGVGNAQRNEILELFPELCSAKGIEDYQAARRSLKKHEAKLLIK